MTSRAKNQCRELASAVFRPKKRILSILSSLYYETMVADFKSEIRLATGCSAEAGCMAGGAIGKSKVKIFSEKFPYGIG